MASTHSYVITVGTTPVPDGSLAMRRALRRGEVRRRAAHRAPSSTAQAAGRAGGSEQRSPAQPATTLIFAGSARRRGAHRAGAHRVVRTARGRHRAPDRRVAGHRATRQDVRRRRIIRTRENGVVLRAVVPLFLLVLVTVVFVSAWFTATGAEAFASIVKP